MRLGGGTKVMRGRPAVQRAAIYSCVAALSAPVALELLDETPTSDELRLNQTTSGIQENGSLQNAVAIDSSGDYVTAWQGPDAAGTGVLVRRFDATGSALSNDIPVNTTTTGDQIEPAIASDSAGNFVVAWTSDDADGDGVFARRFNAAGTPQGTQIPVNTTTTNNQNDPTLAMDFNGNFVIAWDGNGTGDADGVFFRRFTAAGTPSTEARANDATGNVDAEPAVAMSTSGEFAIAWERHFAMRDDIFVRSFGEPGVPVNLTDVKVNVIATNGFRDDPAIAYFAGTFVVGWTDYSGADGDGQGAYARAFNAPDATPKSLSGDIRLNSTTAGNQGRPAVALGPGGDFVAAWMSDGQDGDGEGIFLRRLAADATPLSSEQRVNVTTSLDQRYPGISSTSSAVSATPSSGQFVVAWDGNGTADASGIFGRLYELAAADTTPPSPDLSGPKQQRVGPKVGLMLTCGADACLAEVGGVMTVAPAARRKLSALAGARRRFKLKEVSRQIPVNTMVTIRLKLPRKARRAARRALKRGGRASVLFNVKLTDTAGNSKTAKRRVRLKL